MADQSNRLPSILPRSLPEMIDLAERVSKSTAVPESFRGKAGDCLIAMMMGLEVGLKPLQALQSIAVINGRPCIWGDGARGLVMASGLVESIIETDPGEVAKTKKARCEITRKDVTGTFIGEFGEADALRAGLNGKQTYKAYPVQMYQWRAFHFAARKAFADIYKGLGAVEEYQDVIDVTPVPMEPDDPPTAAKPLEEAEIVHATKKTRGGGTAVPASTADAPKARATPPEQPPPRSQPKQAATPEVVDPLLTLEDQMGLIAGAKKAGIALGRLSELLFTHFGVEDTAQLTQSQAAQFLTLLDESGKYDG